MQDKLACGSGKEITEIKRPGKEYNGKISEMLLLVLLFIRRLRNSKRNKAIKKKTLVEGITKSQRLKKNLGRVKSLLHFSLQSGEEKRITMKFSSMLLYVHRDHKNY